MRIPAAIALGLALASCAGEPPIECTNDGMIVIPAGLAKEVRKDWEKRNSDLALRRFDYVLEQAPYQTASTLEKAKGCP